MDTIAPKVPKEPRQRVTRRGHVDFPGRAIPTLTLAFKAPAFSPKDKTVVSCEVLGPLLFGRQSDVYQKLVVNEKLVLSPETALQPFSRSWITQGYGYIE